MTVICLTNCPPRLRGDLTKWLIEINTGVYVGNLNARLRDELWDRITENIRSGQATMVFRAPGEQRMDFRVHNTTWQPVDYDGLKLIRKPNPEAAERGEAGHLEDGFSKAAKIQKARAMRGAREKAGLAQDYTVLDLETTGLDYRTDEIIEIAALRVRDGNVAAEFQRLVRAERPIPQPISRLTGITDEMTAADGESLKEAITALSEFIASDRIVCWNTAFDIAFLQIGCDRCGVPVIHNKATDALKLAQRKLKRLSNHQLSTVAQHLGIECGGTHRALEDCRLTHAVFMKLNENTTS